MQDRKTIVVTGGSRGVGRAICMEAAKRGFDVCFSYVCNDGAAARVVDDIRRIGVRCTAVKADLAEPEAPAQILGAVGSEFGNLYALVNNAGITGPVGAFAESDQKAIRTVFDVNVLGLMECTRLAIARLSTASGGGGGAIVNVTSGAAQTGSPGRYVWYAASKAAVETFTRGVAVEVAGQGIRVNGVSPGVTDTDIHAAPAGSAKRAMLERSIPIGHMATPEDIARPVLWLLSDEAAYVTGAILRVAGGR